MARNNSLAAGSHILQAAGFSHIGHIVRASSYAVGANASFAQLATTMGSVAVGFTGLIVAAKLVETGLNALEKSATSLVGAIAQLGGARGLQEMFVESVTNAGLINQARFSVGTTERMSVGDMRTRAESLSEDATAGAFKASDWYKVIREIGIITGEQASVSKDTQKFIGQYALVSGMTLSAAGDVFGKMKSRNAGMSDDEIMRAMVLGHGIGQKGSFDIKELKDANRLMQLEGQLGGNDSMAKLQQLFSIGTIMKPGAGSLDIAGTQFKAFLKQAQTSGGPFKFGQDKEIMNLTESLSYLADTPESAMGKKLMAGRSKDFITNFKFGINQRAGVGQEDFSPEANTKRQAVIDSFMKLHMTMEEFAKEVIESTTPQKRFEAAFNHISDMLEGRFLKIMETLAQPGGAMDQFSFVIEHNADKIGGYFTNLAAWIGVLIKHLPELIDGVIGLASAVGKVIIWALELVGQSKEKLLARQAEQKEMLNSPVNQEWLKHFPEEMESRKKALADTEDSLKIFNAVESMQKGFTKENIAKEVAEEAANMIKAAKDADAKAVAAENAKVIATTPPPPHPEQKSQWDKINDMNKRQEEYNRKMEVHLRNIQINTQNPPPPPPVR